MAVANHTFGIQQVGFGRAVNAQVQAQAALVIGDIEQVGIAQVLLPAHCVGIVILVVKPVDRHATVSDLT